MFKKLLYNNWITTQSINELSWNDKQNIFTLNDVNVPLNIAISLENQEIVVYVFSN